MKGSYSDYIKKEQYDLALKDIGFRLDDDRYNIELLIVKAQVLSKLEQYLEAIDLYSTVINLVPGQAEYHADRGLCYHFLNEYADSLADFSKAVDLEPENPYRYASRAFVKDAQGDSYGALEDYEVAIKLDPEDAISLNNKGLIEDKLGRIKAAEHSFTQSDKISGVSTDNSEFSRKKIIRKNPAKLRMGIRYFYTILMGLFTSSVERKKFYKFITQR